MCVCVCVYHLIHCFYIKIMLVRFLFDVTFFLSLKQIYIIKKPYKRSLNIKTKNQHMIEMQSFGKKSVPYSLTLMYF